MLKADSWNTYHIYIFLSNNFWEAFSSILLVPFETIVMTTPGHLRGYRLECIRFYDIFVFWHFEGNKYKEDVKEKKMKVEAFIQNVIFETQFDGNLD